jgi:hypothetical protein
MSGKVSKGFAGFIAVIGIIVVASLLVSVFPSPSNQGYAPVQPIPYSHKKHAGLYKMDCKYCHSDVERSRHAGVPGVGVCMNCHSVVKTDSPLIQQIQKAYKENRPVEWVRVHELPEFVYFPHKRHVAKGLACQTCHGPIENMDVVYQYAPLTMGWCMECHRGKSTPANVLEQLPPEKRNGYHAQVADVNCSTCHN